MWGAAPPQYFGGFQPPMMPGPMPMPPGTDNKEVANARPGRTFSMRTPSKPAILRQPTRMQMPVEAEPTLDASEPDGKPSPIRVASTPKLAQQPQAVAPRTVQQPRGTPRPLVQPSQQTNAGTAVNTINPLRLAQQNQAQQAHARPTAAVAPHAQVPRPIAARMPNAAAGPMPARPPVGVIRAHHQPVQRGARPPIAPDTTVTVTPLARMASRQVAPDIHRPQPVRRR